MIIPVWKPLGASTHQLAQRVGKLVSSQTNNPVDKKATHTGTLDPMAEGVVVVLTGKDRFKKQELSGVKKTYEFGILFGVSTDSHDLLGLQTAITDHNLPLKKIEKEVKKILSSFIGEQTQLQPSFSAQRISGKSAFELAKRGNRIDQKQNNITVFDFEILNTQKINLDTSHSDIVAKIKKVSGDFRQEKILKDWGKTIGQLKKVTDVLPLITFSVTTSKRAYVRAFTRDISQKIGVPATTSFITRTVNGEFTETACKNF